MSWFSRRDDTRRSGPTLRIEGLDVYYGRAHALQGVSLELHEGTLAVVGRNGMGKTTLCNAITGLLPPNSSVRGSVQLAGEELLGRAPNAITERGVAYVPQGRRVWPSLSVDEHLRLAARNGARGAWNVERIYRTFPRLAERRENGGAELSGGEQQMLAISRALLLNPRLLVMDEPTEGLAPVIVQQVADMLRTLASEAEMAILVIEQNLGVAIQVAETIEVMVNGRIARSLPSTQLAGDRVLQQQLLGVRAEAATSANEASHGAGAGAGAGAREASAASGASGPGVAVERTDADDASGTDEQTVRVFTVRRADGAGQPLPAPIGERTTRGFTRWNAGSPGEPPGDRPNLGARSDHGPRPESRSASGYGSRSSPVGPQDRLLSSMARDPAAPLSSAAAAGSRADGSRGRVLEFPVAATATRAAYVAGTFDTKGRELLFLRGCLEKLGVRAVTVDLSTSGKSSSAMVSAREVARHHPGGEAAVFTGDRGSAVVEMAVAFEHFITTRGDVGGLISAGGSGGTALATAAMRRLPIGLPKLMVSTVACGDVRPYVGPSDITMMYSVTDVSGINRISARVLSNAAHALAGMIAWGERADSAGSDTRPAIGLTMFGVTTPCVQAVSRLLEDRYDCLVFHATGTGGQSMEKLADSSLLAGVIDVTPTEIADELVGGVLSAGPERLDAIIRSRIPYVGSCGALDMVNFWAMDTVPTAFRSRNLYRHNQNVTLMRTSAEECARIGRFIVEKLNRMEGPVRFLVPEGGVSAIDAPKGPFHDPAADRALFDAIASGFRSAPNRKLLRLPHHLNDEAFAQALAANFLEIAGPASEAPRRNAG
jgi:uncharacterized protein (UPF0261 family)/ABC-type branched-subunit amino acid transport system ATPase component